MEIFSIRYRLSHHPHEPHDKLLKLRLSDPATAAAFLREQIPATIEVREISCRITWGRIIRRNLDGKLKPRMEANSQRKPHTSRLSL